MVLREIDALRRIDDLGGKSRGRSRLGQHGDGRQGGGRQRQGGEGKDGGFVEQHDHAPVECADPDKCLRRNKGKSRKVTDV